MAFRMPCLQTRSRGTSGRPSGGQNDVQGVAQRSSAGGQHLALMHRGKRPQEPERCVRQDEARPRFAWRGFDRPIARDQIRRPSPAPCRSSRGATIGLASERQANRQRPSKRGCLPEIRNWMQVRRRNFPTPDEFFRLRRPDCDCHARPARIVCVTVNRYLRDTCLGSNLGGSGIAAAALTACCPQLRSRPEGQEYAPQAGCRHSLRRPGSDHHHRGR